MKLEMTIDEALAFADEWSRGLTLYPGAQGWRVVCMLLAEEVRRLREAGAEAADVLQHEATILRDCHTLNGEWDGSEPEVEAGYQRFMALAARLTPNAK